jgi:hypothetical protein
MENHDHNGHGESHDDHATEGNRQYYPKGWSLPLIGLVIVALGFTVIGYFAFNVSGTDKWGKSEQCETGHGHGDGHGDKKGECCAEGKECDHHKGGHEAKDEHGHGTEAHGTEGTMAPTGDHKDSASPAPTPVPAAEEHHDGGDGHHH